MKEWIQKELQLRFLNSIKWTTVWCSKYHTHQQVQWLTKRRRTVPSAGLCRLAWKPWSVAKFGRVRSGKPHTVETTSITSSDYAEFVREATEDDADSYFVTPPGPLRSWREPTREPLNNLEDGRGPAVMPLSRNNAVDSNVYELQYPFHQPRFPVKVIRPTTVALSQSAPGLGGGCLRIGFGRGHWCTARFAKTYFYY